jgi:thioredoxin 1
MKPVSVTDSSFKSEVLESDTIVVADFWAPWCGPCRAISPVLDETAANWAGRLKVVKINVDENRKTASDYSVTSIPTLIFFKGGQVVDRMTGWIPASQLSLRIERLLAPPVGDLSPFRAGRGVQ